MTWLVHRLRSWLRRGNRTAAGPQPAIPRHDHEQLEREAIEWGARAGRDASEGRHHADTIDELPGRRLIAQTCGLRLTDTEIALQRQASALHAKALAARQREQDGLEAHEREALELAALDRDLQAAVPDRAPHTAIYLVLLGLLGVAEFPTVRTALQMFPAGHVTRTVLAVALSIVLACAAHFLAKTLRAAIDGHGRRGEATLQRAVAAFLLAALAALVLLMAITRGASFRDISEITGGAFGDPELMGWMLFTLQVTLLAIAVAVALLHADGDEWRRLKRAVEQARKRERQAKARRDNAAIRRSTLEQQITDHPRLARGILIAEQQFAECIVQLHDAHYAAAASHRPMAPTIPLRGRERAA